MFHEPSVPHILLFFGGGGWDSLSMSRWRLCHAEDAHALKIRFGEYSSHTCTTLYSDDAFLAHIAQCNPPTHIHLFFLSNRKVSLLR